MFVAIAAVALAQDSGWTVEGAVTDAVTKLPIAGAKVSILPADTAADVFSDASGGFRFEGVAQGSYTVRVSYPGYREQSRFTQYSAGVNGMRFEVRLMPLTELEGQVLDEDGQPMAGALIYSGVNMLAETGKDGHFHIHDLAPGDLRLYCRMTFEARKKLLERDEKTGEVRGYADTYYFPGVADPQRAMKTTLSGGMHLTGVDFRLRRGPLVTFSGRVVERSGGAALRGAAVELDPGGFLLDETWKRRNVDDNGGFRFELIAPGRYTLLVYRGGAEDKGVKPYRAAVDIGAGGLTDHEVQVPENVDVTVNITAPHPEKAKGVVRISIGPHVAVSGNPTRMLVVVQPLCIFGESCVVRNIPPGEWTFDVQVPGMHETGDSPRLLYLAGVRLGQQEAWNRPVTIAEGGNPPLEIVLTGDVGTIAATVTGDDGKPAPAKVGAQRVGGTEPLHDKLNELLAGDYLVAAFAAGDIDTMRFGSPELCGDRAAKVTVTAGQTTLVSLKPCVLDPR
jgi:hypothetical protein